MAPEKQQIYWREYYQRNRVALAARKREYMRTKRDAFAEERWDPRQSEAASIDPVMSYDEIAEQLGISKARVGQIMGSALRKLRRQNPALRELLP